MSGAMRVAVVAHDAGGAEILASHVQDQALASDALFVLAGPALKVFRQRLGDVEVTALAQALPRCDWVLSGTGWQTDFEWQAFCQGRQAGKRVVAYLDHWVNYSARFIRHGQTCWPDEIWVGDHYALDLARAEFPSLPVRQVDNPYFRHFVQDVARAGPWPRPGEGRDILFVSENIDRPDFEQSDAIRFFMDHVAALGAQIGRIRIRLHPSEPAGKYDWVARDYPRSVDISTGHTLVEDVARSDIVVGCSTMAMALAVMAGRRVVSCIPDGRFPFTLPFREIESLERLISAGANPEEGQRHA